MKNKLKTSLKNLSNMSKKFEIILFKYNLYFSNIK